jgi:hypothetical protein
MDPLKVEEADRQFVLKLHQLRSKLAGRQQENRNRPLKQAISRVAVLILATLVIAGVGFAVFFQKENAAPAVARLQGAAPLDSMPGLKAETGGLTGQTAAAGDSGPDENEPLVIQSEAPPIGESQERSPFAFQEKIEKETEKEIENAQDSLAAGTRATAQDPDAPAAARDQEEADDPNIELISAVACDGVRQHRPFGKKEVFDTRHARRAYVWMEVKSRQQPFVIKHVYYLDGRKYCEVPLDIAFPRMRTWSYVTFGKADPAGTWTVEIVCNGRVLKTVGFQVRHG